MHKRKIYPAILLLLSLSFSIFAQENVEVNEFAKLSKEITPQKTIKSLNEVISNAEDIYKSNQKKFQYDKEELAQTTLDFALFRSKIFQMLNSKLGKRNSNIGGLEFLKLYESNAKELEKLFETSIDIYEKSLKVENTQLATAKFEFANSLGSYKMMSKDTDDVKKREEKINKIQNLYLEAYTIWAKLLDKNDETVLVSGFHLANNYLSTADFEKALPLYKKYIDGVTEKFGSKSEILLPALQVNASIWNLIGRVDEVEKIKKQITEITNNNDEIPVAELSITPRVKSDKYKGLTKIYGGFVNTTRAKIARVNVTEKERRSINTPITGPIYEDVTGGPRNKFIRTKAIKSIITVDNKGNVIDVKAETEDAKLKKKIEKEIKKWTFEPFVHNGKQLEMKGLVYYQVKVEKKAGS